MHLFAAYYFLVVLPLEHEWGRPYHELIELWTVGAFLVGAMAVPAGWLADRWNSSGMMIVYFLGLGASAILCGAADSPQTLWIALCLLGAFAGIYHPVGIAWVVRTAASRGKALGINGIFGSLGVSAAGLVAGSLIDHAGWRTAFVVPGVVSIATGLVMLGCLIGGVLREGTARGAAPEPQGARESRLHTFAILMITTFGSAVVYQSTQAAMPKLFASRLADLAGPGTLGVGTLVALVYGLAGLTQVMSGHLADRYDLKTLYVTAYALQGPLLWVAAGLGGPALVVVTTAMVIANIGSLPAESMLLAQTTPHTRHGLVFGLKFVLTFTAAPLAIKLVAYVHDVTGEFYWVFVALAIVAFAMAVAAALLPVRAPVPRPAPVAGELEPVDPRR